MPASREHLHALYKLFASVKTEKEARSLLEDILTPQELDAVAERWQLIRALASGKSQRTIARELKLSISKITRGSRMLKYGSGGFQHFLQKLKK
ncbi:MAG: Trp family transcriptional regulator [Candidatus Peribacteraceae bacterium]|nr:Trp family transcriptional regulator [Candidatus Peribacteraceae bacterium]